MSSYVFELTDVSIANGSDTLQINNSDSVFGVIPGSMLWIDNYRPRFVQSVDNTARTVKLTASWDGEPVANLPAVISPMGAINSMLQATTATQNLVTASNNLLARFSGLESEYQQYVDDNFQNLLQVVNEAGRYNSVSGAVALALSGDISVGKYIATMSYYDGLSYGGNFYQLLDAGSSAARPSHDGGSIIHVGTDGLYLSAIFLDGVWMEQFGARPDIDNAPIMATAMAFVSSAGLGVLKGRPAVYPISNITLPHNVRIMGHTDYVAMNILDIAAVTPDATGALVLQALPDSTGALIRLDGATGRRAGLEDLIIDARNHDGDVVVADSSSGSVTRPLFTIVGVLVYGGTGKQLWLTSLARGTMVKESCFRGGDTDVTAQSDYGIYDESIDSKFYRVFAAFTKIRCIYDAGGAGRRENVDVWGCQQVGIEIAAQVTYYRLQSDGHWHSGIRLNNVGNAQFTTVITINNGLNLPEAYEGGDFEVLGYCQGTVISNAQLRGSQHLPFGLYKDDYGVTSPAYENMVIGTGYDTAMNDYAEAYGDFVNLKSTVFELPLMRANQLNPNVSMTQFTNGAPTGWENRNGGTSELTTTLLPAGYKKAVQINSSPTGSYDTSGLMFVIPVEQVRGRRVRVKSIVRGDASTYPNNQFLSFYDGVNNPRERIENNSIFQEVAMVYDVPDEATVFQVRFIASNENIEGLILVLTGVTIEVY